MNYRRFVNQVAVGAALAVLATAGQADTIYVDDDSPGGDGSELDPYCSIQTAIDAAVDPLDHERGIDDVIDGAGEIDVLQDNGDRGRHGARPQLAARRGRSVRVP